MSNKANRKMRRLADKVNGNAAQEQSAMTVSQFIMYLMIVNVILAVVNIALLVR